MYRKSATLINHNKLQCMIKFPDMEQPKIGVAVILVRNNKILLGLRTNSHGDGSWSTSGGHLEYGESFEECAARELYEETGLRAKNYQIASVTNDIFSKEQKHYLTVFMYCEYAGGTLTIREPKKCKKWDWYNWDKLPHPLFVPVANLVRQGYSPFRQAANERTTRCVYLSGSIPKTKTERETFIDWREEFMHVAKKQKLDIIGVNPNVFSYDMMDVKYFFGRDVQQIYISDVIIVNAVEKIGLGTAQELLIAQFYKKPVIAIAPFPSHYHKSIDTPKQKKLRYIHPFLTASASVIVDDYQNAVRILKNHYLGKKKLKTISIDSIEAARQSYLHDALKNDSYVKDLLTTISPRT